jgi:hypothetical protein
LILLADTKILSDLCAIDGLPLAALIAPTEVLDYVVEDAINDGNTAVKEQVMSNSISIVKTERAWLKHITEKGLGLQDKLNLYYAKMNKRIMLSGEKRLGSICKAQRIDFRGPLWLIDEALKRKMQSSTEVCQLLELLNQDRVVHQDEIQKRRKAIGCKHVA